MSNVIELRLLDHCVHPMCYVMDVMTNLRQYYSNRHKITKREYILNPFEVLERQTLEVENIVEENKYLTILFFSQRYTNLHTCQKSHPSSFAGHGNKTAWTIWTVLPEHTNALLKLSSAQSGIPDNVMHTIERFVILLYDRTSTCKEINKPRKKIFATKNNVQLIPPTKAALEEHVKRAAYQGGHVWGQTLLPTPELPPPSSWGWIKNDEGVYEPHWTKLHKATQTCYELVSCKCKKGCVKRCKCKKAALECTALCACEGECSQN